MWLQPQIRYPAAQRSRTAKTRSNDAQGAPPHLWCEGHLNSDSHLGGRGLSLLSAAQSSPAVVAPLGDQALGNLDPSPNAPPGDQSRYHRPPRLKAKRRLLKKRLYGRTKPGTLLKHHIPIKTDSWDVKTPGFTETDLVSHCGNSEKGEFIHSLNVTDIHTTWVESRAVMGKGQAGVLEAMKEIEGALPFKLLGIDSDNGSEFINYHLKAFCDQKNIQFTRGRPYKKDDNAHIEQKNWTHVRKIFGYLRYDSFVVQQAINDLYRNELRTLQNLFLPSMKLVSKARVGSKLKRRYDKPQTPFERVAACPGADPLKIAALQKLRDATDPFALAKTIDQKLQRIYQLANHRVSPNFEPPQRSPRPLTRAERQARLEILETLGVQAHVGTQKTTSRRVTF